jgi:uncharacterized protein YbjT (DUF2867 family)
MTPLAPALSNTDWRRVGCRFHASARRPIGRYEDEEEEAMKVAVVGATGKTGGAVASFLLARGHQVRAVVRDPGRTQDLVRRGAEAVACDLSDEAQTRAALAGAEGVYYCSPQGMGHPNPFDVEASWGRHALAGAKAAGVSHFVFLSVQGPETAPGVALLETKRMLEKDLAASGLPYTVLRPNMFMDNPEAFAHEELRGGRFSWPLSPAAQVQPVAARDIGEVAARALESGPRNRAFNVLGPEPLTLPRMMEILGRALGRDIEYRELSDQEFVTRVGPFVGPPLALGVAAAYRLWERESPVGDPAPLRQEFAVALTSCEDYARGLAEAWRSRGV